MRSMAFMVLLGVAAEAFSIGQVAFGLVAIFAAVISLFGLFA